MDRRQALSQLLSVLASVLLPVGLIVALIAGKMALESEWFAVKPAEISVRCEDGRLCNEISFPVDVPDWNLVGFEYHVKSWASEDSRRGCHILVDMNHSQMFYGANVLSFTADLADGAKAGVGVQYARVELYCKDGHISHRDVTKKN